MCPAKIIDYLRDLVIAFYRSISKLSINAHQLIAHWRSRINNNNNNNNNNTTTNNNINNKNFKNIINQNHHSNTGIGKLSSTRTTSISNSITEETELQTPVKFGQNYDSIQKSFNHQHQHHQLSSQSTQSSLSYSTLKASTSQTSHQIGLTFNAPNIKRLKLYSILRRLSIRNFMEYCVIALNEASSSSCSNKFDLNSCETPVWLLGKNYRLPEDTDELVEDIKSKLWITYRRNFPPIDDNSRYTTDRGFGCMIRCGQMVLANAFIYKNLGRDWRWLPNGFESNPSVYNKILRLFQDKEDSPYSIHNIVRSGQQEGIVIGEWFGPNTIAQALKRMALAHQRVNDQSSNTDLLISIDAALDNVVVIDEIKSRFKQEHQLKKECNDDETILKSPPQQTQTSSTSTLGTHANGDSVAVHREQTSSSIRETSSKDDKDDSSANKSDWIPGILFIQLRLGLTKINPLYFAALKKTFQFKNSLGIIGGRPNHALYLIGYTENDIIYLDPHSTQQFIDFDTTENNKTLPTNLPTEQQHRLSESGASLTDHHQHQALPIDSTYHCACPEKMPIDRLDPSLALCFYFHTESEFEEWCSSSKDLLIKFEQAPMFEIIESRTYESCQTTTNTRTISELNLSKKSDEEFELLG